MMQSVYTDSNILLFGCQKGFLIILDGIMTHYRPVQRMEESVPRACLNCLRIQGLPVREKSYNFK